MSSSEHSESLVQAACGETEPPNVLRPWQNTVIEALFSKMLLDNAPEFSPRNFNAVIEEYEAAILRAYHTPSCRDQHGLI
ncbi:hypothetical protein ELH91_10145 [Rhizobium leguminosarum]|uniref:hypothetical protein n=1 Tax=Rhizobium leguminosarum TaxID=384 RepID=UPI00103176D7|nr:hypothetical protein [Rhizobium leguminosarum]TAY17101.1 hypothetical protein ELH91_10145 [Rhizobium leguminosarum]